MINLIMSLILAVGQVGPQVPAPEWKLESYKFGQYGRSYEFSIDSETYCKIFVRRDGSGIRIEACVKEEKGNTVGVWSHMTKAKTDKAEIAIVFFRDSYDRKLRDDLIPPFAKFWKNLKDEEVQFFLQNYPEKNNGVAEVIVPKSASVAPIK